MNTILSKKYFFHQFIALFLVQFVGILCIVKYIDMPRYCLAYREGTYPDYYNNISILDFYILSSISTIFVYIAIKITTAFVLQYFLKVINIKFNKIIFWGIMLSLLFLEFAFPPFFCYSGVGSVWNMFLGIIWIIIAQQLSYKTDFLLENRRVFLSVSMILFFIYIFYMYRSFYEYSEMEFLLRIISSFLDTTAALISPYFALFIFVIFIKLFDKIDHKFLYLGWLMILLYSAHLFYEIFDRLYIGFSIKWDNYDDLYYKYFIQLLFSIFLIISKKIGCSTPILM